MTMDHIALYVNNLEGAKDFFVTYFGAVPNKGYHNPKTGFRSYFLSFDSGSSLEIMCKPVMVEQEKNPDRTGYAHLSFGVGSKEAVDALTLRMKEDGYPVLNGPRTTGDGYYESSLRGFEGNLIEIKA